MNNNKYELNSSLNKIGGNEEELYKQKYLKYKQKYLKLKVQKGGAPKTEEEELLIRLNSADRKVIANEIYSKNRNINYEIENVKFHEEKIKLCQEILNSQKIIIEILSSVRELIIKNESTEVKYGPELIELQKMVSDKEENLKEGKKKGGLPEESEKAIFDRIEKLDKALIVKEISNLESKWEELAKKYMNLKEQLDLLKLYIETNKSNIETIKEVCNYIADEYKKLKNPYSS
jgi:hypothetical protein